MKEYKAIIVEGKSDKIQLKQILDEEVDIFCTHGTASDEQLEGLLDPALYHNVFILTDADFPGERLRSRLREYYPNAVHLFTRRMYREVATTPLEELARLMAKAHFQVAEDYLI